MCKCGRWVRSVIIAWENPTVNMNGNSILHWFQCALWIYIILIATHRGKSIWYTPSVQCLWNGCKMKHKLHYYVVFICHVRSCVAFVNRVPLIVITIATELWNILKYIVPFPPIKTMLSKELPLYQNNPTFYSWCLVFV